MSLDFLFHRKYNEDNYNCAHLVCEAWYKKTKEDISEILIGVLQPAEQRYIDIRKRFYFKKIKKPVTPCIIHMKRKGSPSHVGIFIDGKVMQITRDGVQNQPLEISTRGYKTIHFYRKR